MKCAGCDLNARFDGKYCSTPCYKKHYRLLNLAKIKANNNYHYQNNKKKIISNVNEWRKSNKDKVRITASKSKKKNKKPLTSLEKIKHSIRTRMHDALNGRTKPDSVTKSLGCSWDTFKKYIEDQFYDHPLHGIPMTWDNMGKRFCENIVWNIDHIEPLCSFNLTDPEQFKKACNYINLQPLWHEDHIKKTKEDISSLRKAAK